MPRDHHHTSATKNVVQPLKSAKQSQTQIQTIPIANSPFDPTPQPNPASACHESRPIKEPALKENSINHVSSSNLQIMYASSMLVAATRGGSMVEFRFFAAETASSESHLPPRPINLCHPYLSADSFISPHWHILFAGHAKRQPSLDLLDCLYQGRSDGESLLPVLAANKWCPCLLALRDHA